eukprot:12914853-Prorocentrum_lima.AAC.1
MRGAAAPRLYGSICGAICAARVRLRCRGERRLRELPARSYESESDESASDTRRRWGGAHRPCNMLAPPSSAR